MPEPTLGELKRRQLLESQQSGDNCDVTFEPRSVKRRNDIVIKHKKKGPVELPNNVAFNPFGHKLKKGTKSRLLPRDPRFSDYSGTFNPVLFKKSYSFINEMRQEEIKELKSVLKGVNASKKSQCSKAALAKLSRFGIEDFDSAKRLMDRLETQENQVNKREEFEQFKKSLLDKERESIISTSKKPFYYSEKKVKKLFKQKDKNEMQHALESSAIDYGKAKSVHKKLAKKSKQKLSKERQNIPKVRNISQN